MISVMALDYHILATQYTRDELQQSLFCRVLKKKQKKTEIQVITELLEKLEMTLSFYQMSQCSNWYVS